MSGIANADQIEAKLIKGFEILNQDLIKESEKLSRVFSILNHCTANWELR